MKEFLSDVTNQICFVDFNYDISLENCHDFGEMIKDNIPTPDSRLNSYISGQVKLIKLHGSCDWGYPIKKLVNNEEFIDLENFYRFLINNPKMVLDYKEKLSKIREHPIYRTKRHYIIDEKSNIDWCLYPAIAIPLPQKDTFICPESHIKELENALKQTDRILIIGWRAGDRNLVNLMNNNIEIGKKIFVTIVTDGEKSETEIKNNLQKVNDRIEYKESFIQGFSDFVKRRGHEIFFQ